MRRIADNGMCKNNWRGSLTKGANIYLAAKAVAAMLVAQVAQGMSPTAAITMEVNGQAALIVTANTPVIFKPSPDTLDPDSIGQSPCTNPGIVKADFIDSAGYLVQVIRTTESPCEPLQAILTFHQMGPHRVTMIVTNANNQTATSEMNFSVSDHTVLISDLKH